MKRSPVVLAELTHSAPLLGPAWGWIHEIARRHGNMLRDWKMATNLVREPLLKGGLTNRQPPLTHFCCFAFWHELEKEKQRLFNISLHRIISRLLPFFRIMLNNCELLGVSEGSLGANQTLFLQQSMCNYDFPFHYYCPPNIPPPAAWRLTNVFTSPAVHQASYLRRGVGQGSTGPVGPSSRDFQHPAPGARRSAVFDLAPSLISQQCDWNEPGIYRISLKAANGYISIRIIVPRKLAEHMATRKKLLVEDGC